MVYIEKKRKFNRIVTLLFIYTFLIGVLTLLLMIVTPQLMKNIKPDDTDEIQYIRPPGNDFQAAFSYFKQQKIQAI